MSTIDESTIDGSSAARTGGPLGVAAPEFDGLTYEHEFGDVAAALGLAVAPIEPRASMKADLLALIAVTPQLPAHAIAAPDAPSAFVPSLVPTAPPAQDAPVTASAATPGPSERAAQRRWFQRSATIMSAAAAAVVLFAGGVIAGGALAPVGTGEQHLAAIVASPDVRMTPAEVTVGGSTTLVSSASLGTSAMVFEGLPPLSADEAYALWYIDPEGTADPAGLFSVDSESRVVAVLEGTYEPGTVIGVTVEPAEGSPAPTSQPIVVIATEA